MRLGSRAQGRNPPSFVWRAFSPAICLLLSGKLLTLVLEAKRVRQLNDAAAPDQVDVRDISSRALFRSRGERQAGSRALGKLR